MTPDHDAKQVVVPVEPTEAMLAAATREGLDGPGVSSETGGWHGYYRRVWTAMLSASPVMPVEERRLEIAEIVDPRAWAVEIGRLNDSIDLEARRCESLAKADAILSALSPQLQGVGDAVPAQPPPP